MILSEQERKQLEDDLEQQIGNHAFGAIERVLLAKLAGAELPSTVWVDVPHFTYTVDQLRQAYAQGAASQLAEKPTCWVTPDGEGFRMRLSPPVNPVPLGWQELYTRKEPK